jgi:hypothetical protein
MTEQTEFFLIFPFVPLFPFVPSSLLLNITVRFGLDTPSTKSDAGSGFQFPAQLFIIGVRQAVPGQYPQMKNSRKPETEN